MSNEVITESPLSQPASSFRDAFLPIKSKGSFGASGIATTLPASPNLKIRGVEEISFPLQEKHIDAIRRVAFPAPYGRGMATLHNKEVRDCLQIDAINVDLSCAEWNGGMTALITTAVADLGINPSFVRAELYKLLLYTTGGHFKAHRDTEKEIGMFATLVVQLPSTFNGGGLIVRHHGKEHQFKMGSDDQSAQSQCYYAVHYADCEHEVETVHSGHRLVALYSLCWTGDGPPLCPPSDESVALLANRLSTLKQCIGIILKHEYTLSSLRRYGLRALKGDDRAISDSLQIASKTMEEMNPESGLVLHLVHAKRVVVDDENGGEDRHPPELQLWQSAIFRPDGSPCDPQTLTFLQPFQFYEDIVNSFQENEDSSGEGEYYRNDRWWKDAQGNGVRVSGNEGAGEATTYGCYVLTIWRRNCEFELLCRSNLVDALQVVLDHPDQSAALLERATPFLHDCDLERGTFAPIVEKLLEIGAPELVVRMVELTAEKPLHPVQKELRRFQSQKAPFHVHDERTFFSWLRDEQAILNPGMFGIPNEQVIKAVADAVLRLGWERMAGSVEKALDASQKQSKPPMAQLSNRLELLYRLFPHVKGKPLLDQHLDEFLVFSSLKDRPKTANLARKGWTWGLKLLFACAAQDPSKLDLFMRNIEADQHKAHDIYLVSALAELNSVEFCSNPAQILGPSIHQAFSAWKAAAESL